MARLTALPSRLTPLPSRLGGSRPGDKRAQSIARDADSPSRRWYKTARWQALRWSVLRDAGFVCCRCRYASQPMAAQYVLMVGIGQVHLLDPRRDSSCRAPDLVADHIEPHRGDESMFWDRENIQCLCKTCHDRDKQREERAR